MPAVKLLLVEDEPFQRDAAKEYLASQGFGVTAVGTAEEFRLAAQAEPPDLALLDVRLPEEDGFALARWLRARDPRVGIIMLTAADELIDRVVGLESGADDYIGKPFEPRELLARIRAVLRRAAAPRPGAAPAAAPAVSTAPQLDQASSPAAQPVAEASGSEAYITELWVQERHGAVRVPLDGIEWIEAERDYVLLHAGARSHTLRTTMADLERRLDPARMVRVHRSAFVKVGAVDQVQRTARSATLVLRSGAAVPVGPSYMDAIGTLTRAR